MVTLKNVLIVILGFIVSAQILFIVGKLPSVYEFILRYGAYLFVVAIIIGLIIFLCICF
jgi:hypothetical protein